MIASRLYSHVCILDAGSIKCHLRGNEDVGQADVPEGNFTQVEVGADFTCALHDNGNVQCWGGINDYGKEITLKLQHLVILSVLWIILAMFIVMERMEQKFR